MSILHGQKGKVIFAVLFFHNVMCSVYALTVGSDTVPSRELFITFPAATNNKILGFAALEKGFKLSGVNTTCTYDAFFPIGNLVNLHGGTLTLSKDLLFSDSTVIASVGKILGNSLSVEFEKSSQSNIIPTVTSTTQLAITDLKLIFNSDIDLRTALHCAGTCKINGRGKTLHLGNGGSIVVKSGGTLLIEDVEVDGVGDTNIRNLVDNGKITLRNAIITLARDYTCTSGAFYFEKENLITGTSKFTYKSKRNSIIKSSGALVLDSDITFSYDPTTTNRNLFDMEDATSKFFWNGCSIFSTHTGMQLSVGRLFISDVVSLTSRGKTANAVIFKDALDLRVLANSTLDITGHLRFEA